MTNSRLGAWVVLAGCVGLAACGGSDGGSTSSGSDGGTAGTGGSSAGEGGEGGSSAAGGEGGSSGSGATSGSGGEGGTGAMSAGGAGAMGGAGGAMGMCGNMTVEGDEECDDGNSDTGDGCEPDCTLTCETDAECDDGDACNGAETCDTSNNTCSTGTPEPDGTSCGTDEFCIDGTCGPATCRDGVVVGDEECDETNVTDGDGCDSDCTFSCVSTDATRDCSELMLDECAGTPACNDATHICESTPLADDTPCNNGMGFCSSGMCTTAVCGNGVPEPGETCDDGDTDETNGCTTNCEFTCTANSDCNDNNPCTQNRCGSDNTCSNPANSNQNGNACSVGGVNGTCDDGVCAPADCGDGDVDSGEECDRGSAQNGQPGSGCTAGCQFECDSSNDCDNGNVCDGDETCDDVAGGAGKTCNGGSQASEGTVCQASPRRICDDAGSCQLSTCGDGFVDMDGGETCEPPGSATCDSNCQMVVAACGNGNLEAGEQCDDGNTDNLDGCDSNCEYEVLYRLTSLEIIKSARPGFCSSANNRLGDALTQTAIDQINPPLADGITAGEINILVQALGLDDLTGANDSDLSMGILASEPDPARGSWPGSGNPADWWFIVDNDTVDSAGLPQGILSPATLSNRTLTAGPGDVSVSVTLAGSAATLAMRNALITAEVLGSPTPNFPGNSPAVADLDPNLLVARAIEGSNNGQGLCGDVTVESLANIAVPDDLASGLTACNANCTNSKSYTACAPGQTPATSNCNSLLDVLVGGCRASFLCVPAITPTQPDTAGTDGDVDTLTLDSNNKVPASQLSDDAYSAYLRFDANRAHASGRQ